MEKPRKAHSHLPSTFEAKRTLARALGRESDSLGEKLTSKQASFAERLLQGPRTRYPHLFEFYCPHCGTQKRLPFSPQPQARHFVQMGLTTVILTLALWPWFGVKGAVVFVPLWAIFELIYRMRVRVRMRCGQCGFDPYLYVTDVGRARHEIEEHWRKIFEAKGLPYPPEKKNWWDPEKKPQNVPPATPPSP